MPANVNFPRLSANNHEKTSQPDVEYNCVAWAAWDTDHWWQPGVYWPVEISRDEHGIAALEAAFMSLGLVECSDGSLEPGFEKIALYGSGFMYTHASRQLPDGRWTSKLGKGGRHHPRHSGRRRWRTLRRSRRIHEATQDLSGSAL
jgi:hypothetical protein